MCIQIRSSRKTLHIALGPTHTQHNELFYTKYVKMIIKRFQKLDLREIMGLASTAVAQCTLRHG